MTENNFKTDLTFFTNKPNANLLDRFVKTLKDVKYFEFFNDNTISHSNLLEHPSEVILSKCFIK